MPNIARYRIIKCTDAPFVSITEKISGFLLHQNKLCSFNALPFFFQMKYSITFLILVLSCYSFAQTNSNIELLSQLEYHSPCSSITGYAGNGKEYALLCTWDGVSIIEVTDPLHPVNLFDVPSAVPVNGSIVYREPATYNQYAYVTNEQDSGILIINLKYLPDSISYHHFKGNGIKTAHTVWVDEKGILYLFGYNTDFVPANGVMMFDLKANPEQPQYVGQFTGTYLHDGYVRGDTLWGAAIYQGQLIIYDIKNKNSFKKIGQKTTPHAFCDNARPTSDNRYVFTADEKSHGYLTSYDVSKTKSIPPPLDSVQSYPGSRAVIHRVHLVTDSFAVCSYYRDGIVIFDVSQPDNIIKIGSYDTSPLSGDGINGAWEVYPFLPSGNLIVSDIEGGLFVLAPQYRLAGRIQGTVTDYITTAVLNGVRIELGSVSTATNYLGMYKTGTIDSGTFTVKISKDGYLTQYADVQLQSGSVATLDVQLVPTATRTKNITPADIHFAASPNPFYMDCRLSFNAGEIKADYITVTDVTGRTLASYFLNSNSETLQTGNDLESGVYFISLYSGNRLLKTIKGIKR